MPIEIRELHIKVIIDPNEPAPPGQGGRQAATASQAGSSSDPDRDALIAECVEQVLAILHEKKER